MIFVNQQLRRTAVTALTNLAASDDYQDRADAGRALANFAEATEAREFLLRLVLDVKDTYVTPTAEALLRRHNTAGLTIVAEALASADLQRGTQIRDAVTYVFMVFATQRDRALEACDALSLDASTRGRTPRSDPAGSRVNLRRCVRAGA
jgi:hypothetical protein